MKIIFVFVNLFYMTLSWADCTFTITNYSTASVVVKVGFRDGNHDTATVNKTSSKIIKIKDALNCNSKTDMGFGVTSIELVKGKSKKDKSKGGWTYDPSANLIRGFGISASSQNMVYGIAPDGTQLALYNNAKPSSDSFDVKIKKADQNISRQLGSMD